MIRSSGGKSTKLGVATSTPGRIDGLEPEDATDLNKCREHTHPSDEVMTRPAPCVVISMSSDTDNFGIRKHLDLTRESAKLNP